jgi:hypothetical protein
MLQRSITKNSYGALELLGSAGNCEVAAKRPRPTDAGDGVVYEIGRRIVVVTEGALRIVPSLSKPTVGSRGL